MGKEGFKKNITLLFIFEGGLVYEKNIYSNDYFFNRNIKRKC